MMSISTESRSPDLPVSAGLRFLTGVSVVVALLMAGVSIAPLLDSAAIYPTEELRKAFLTTDVGNLFIGVPFLLLSLWWAGRGRLIGLLFWPGALFFVLYTYLVYVLAMPLSVIYLLYLALVVLSFYTLIALMSRINEGIIHQQLMGAAPARLSGGVLAVFGVLFLIRNLALIIQSLGDGSALPGTEVALMTTDFLVIPAWIIGGVLLWRRQAAGYTMGLGMLYQGSMLFVGLILVLILQPIMTHASLAVGDLIFTIILSLIFFVPFALFVRATLKAKPPPA